MGNCVGRITAGLGQQAGQASGGVSHQELGRQGAPGRQDPLSRLARPKSMVDTPLPTRAHDIGTHARAYEDGRRALHEADPKTYRSLSPVTRDMLARGSAAIAATRAIVPMRGNVLSDRQITQGQSEARVRLLREDAFEKELLKRCSQLNPSERKVVTLVRAKLMGSGNCGEMAQVAEIEMGRRLGQHEKAEMVESETKDHVWVELVGPDRDDGSERRIVVDPWCEGSAIEAAHSEFAANRAENKRLHPMTDVGRARGMEATVNEALLRLRLDRKFLRGISKKLEEGVMMYKAQMVSEVVGGLVRGEETVLGRDFVSKVSAAKAKEDLKKTPDLP